jgi:eukaryotic-like serine/threonine-protein kinase
VIYSLAVTEEQPQVFGAYLLLKALGRGAMGDVWMARPLNPERGIPAPVVIKRMLGELSNRRGFIARFRHEATLAVSVDSDHVAKVFDVGAVSETLYITMEHVSGWPLSKVLDAILESGRHASVASVIDLIAGGLEGLDQLHTARDTDGKPLGIVHRDISPKNLMVGEDGRMRLIDLGLGKSNAQDWKTRTGVVMGSVGYMPPEQARGERVDARADLYSIAVVCFEMLALRNYVKRGTITQMMEASATPSFVRPSDFRPDIPEALDRVLERALDIDKEKRFQSARQFLSALREVVPPVHTEGGMASLIEDLFGASKREREHEIASLLALPVPDATDGEPTQVFVMREGVLPPDQAPTRYVVNESTMVATKATKVHAPKTRVSGVSIPVLVGAVCSAAIVGGVVAVLLADRLSPPPAVIIESMPPPPASPPPSPVVQEIEAPAPPAELPPPVAPPARAAKKRVEVAKASPPPAPPPDVPAQPLNAQIDALREKATALMNGNPEKKDALLKCLSELSAWKRAGDSTAKQKAIDDLRVRLRDLGAS